MLDMENNVFAEKKRLNENHWKIYYVKQSDFRDLSISNYKTIISLRTLRQLEFNNCRQNYRVIFM